MRGNRPSATESESGTRVTFHGGVRTLAALGVAFATLAILVVLIEDATVATEYPVWVAPVAETATFSLIAGIAVALLRVEDVRPTELGLSRDLLAPAVTTVGALWVALNVLAASLAALTGNPWGLESLADVPVRWEGVPAPRVTTLLFGFFLVALVEEFVFRGYLQTKVVAVLGDGSRRRIALGILTSSLVFGLMHAPGALVAGASPAGVVGTVLFLSLSGLSFGILYEVTHNVYLVALLHWIGNTWPLVADIWSLGGVAFPVALVGVALIYLGAALGYYYWIPDTSRRTVREATGTDV